MYMYTYIIMINYVYMYICIYIYICMYIYIYTLLIHMYIYIYTRIFVHNYIYLWYSFAILALFISCFIQSNFKSYLQTVLHASSAWAAAGSRATPATPHNWRRDGPARRKSRETCGHQWGFQRIWGGSSNLDTSLSWFMSKDIIIIHLVDLWRIWYLIKKWWNINLWWGKLGYLCNISCVRRHGCKIIRVRATSRWVLRYTPMAPAFWIAPIAASMAGAPSMTCSPVMSSLQIMEDTVIEELQIDSAKDPTPKSHMDSGFAFVPLNSMWHLGYAYRLSSSPCYPTLGEGRSSVRCICTGCSERAGPGATTMGAGAPVAIMVKASGASCWEALPVDCLLIFLISHILIQFGTSRQPDMWRSSARPWGISWGHEHNWTSLGTGSMSSSFETWCRCKSLCARQHAAGALGAADVSERTLSFPSKSPPTFRRPTILSGPGNAW